MKNLLNVKILSLQALACFVFLVNSCTSEEKAKDNLIKEEVCNCLELEYDSTMMIYKQNGKLFTGDCVKKNEKGEVIQESSISEGLKLKNKVWTSFGKSLFLTEDMEYSNNEMLNGWYVDITENVDETWIATKSLKEYKNGKESTLWKIDSSDPFMDAAFGNENETYIILNDDSNSKECVTTGLFTKEFFKCVESKKFKNFHYFIK